MATPSDACLPDGVSAISKGQRDSEDGEEPHTRHERQVCYSAAGTQGAAADVTCAPRGSQDHLL